jgi:hypothetical protein
MNGGQPVQARKRCALALRDRDERSIGKAPRHQRQIRQIEPAVQRGEKWRSQPAQERQVHPVQMGMDHVEIAGPFGDRLEQHGTGGSRIRTRAAQAQGPGTDWYEAGSGAGVPAREQRDVMIQADQFVCQPRDHALSPAVQFWRDALSEGRDLRDAHAVRISARLRGRALLKQRRLQPIAQKPTRSFVEIGVRG